MKIALILVSAFMLANGCKTQDKITSETEESSEKIESSSEMEKVTTTATIKKNASYDIMEDSIGKYYISKKDGNSNVFEYKIHKKGEEGLADAEYTETLIFEFTDDMLPLSLSNDALNQVKLMTSKQCKCPDAGYYKVDEGNLSVSKKGKRYIVALEFNVEGLDQKLSIINSDVE